MQPTDAQPSTTPVVTTQPPAGTPPPQPQPAAPQPQQPIQPEGTQSQTAPEPDNAIPEDSLEWEASEFIDHQKNFGWFLLLALGGTAATALVYFILKDILATVVTAVATITFGIFARKKPRTLTYVLTPTYLMVGQKRYSYDDFRTFSVIQEGGLYSIVLSPNQRFIPPLTIYFDPEDGEDIFDILAERIPHEERSADPIDRFMRRIRF